MKVLSKYAILLAVLLILSVPACNGEGGDEDSTGSETAEAPFYDASGEWIMTMEYAQDYGLSQCKTVPNINQSVITQTGNSFSIDGVDGTIDGTAYSVQLDLDENGLSKTMKMNFVMKSDSKYEGTINVYVTNGNEYAQMDFKIKGKRAAKPKFDATGTWRLTADMNSYNYCGKMVTRTYDVTVSQDGALISMTGDFDGDGMSETIEGAVDDDDCILVSDSDDDASKGIVLNLSLSSGSSISNGALTLYECKSASCEMEYTITGTKQS